MTEFWSSLSTVEKLFLFCAVVGGALFLFKLVLMVVGFGDADDADMDVGGDSDLGFRILSIQGITAFFMMFGLVGLAMTRQSGAGTALAALAGLAAGAATVWIIGRIFVAMRKLQTDGTVRPEAAVGQEGSVYLRIAPGGIGKIQVAAQGRLRIYEAVSRSDQVMDTGAACRVVALEGHRRMVVEPVAPPSS